MKSSAPPRPLSPHLQLLLKIIGFILVPIGIAGVILPGLPGTIFLILAVACFARSSPKMEQWLINHPWLGPGIVRWRERGAISLKSKCIALTVMALSGVWAVYSGAPGFVKIFAVASLSCAALFVATRPND